MRDVRQQRVEGLRIGHVCLVEPVLDPCCRLEVMSSQRLVVVLPIEDVGRKRSGSKVAWYNVACPHGILEHIIIGNGRVLFCTLDQERYVRVGRMRLNELVGTDWHQLTLHGMRAWCSLLTRDGCGISR